MIDQIISFNKEFVAQKGYEKHSSTPAIAQEIMCLR